MSEEEVTGYTDDGFIAKDITQIIKEKEDEAIDIFDVINRSISDILWQWTKIVCMERVEQEIMHETATNMMSIQNAVGEFLNKHGIEAGVERKGATKSQGRVDLTASISGADIPIPASTRFSSGVNTYISDEDATIPYQQAMTKVATGLSNDFFPTDIAEVDTVEEIITADGSVIPDSVYALNSTYKNYIEWEIGSSAYLLEDEEYIVRFIGNVTKRIEVSSVDTGPATIATEGKISACIDFPLYSCTNTEDVDGGSDEEIDDAYRERLLGARRRTFTLGKIKDIVLGLDSIRSTKVFQNVGTDQSSIADWDNPTRGADVRVTGQEALLAQSFVPGDQILTLGRITLYGMPVGRPPALMCGIKRDMEASATGIYFDYVKLERTEVDPTVTGYRDLELNLNYNGLDKTKTYRFDLWCDDPGVTGFDWDANYWKISTSTEVYRSDNRGAYWKWNGSSWVDQGDAIDLMFKTHFKGAGFTVITGLNDGYGFDNTKEEIEEQLDYIDGGGYSPICIQPYIIEATEVDVDIKATIFITSLADFDNVRREVEENIEAYLEGLDVGENVVYAKIHQQIMIHSQVTNVRDLEIKRSDVGDYDELDLAVSDDEITDLGTTSFQSG